MVAHVVATSFTTRITRCHLSPAGRATTAGNATRLGLNRTCLPQRSVLWHSSRGPNGWVLQPSARLRSDISNTHVSVCSRCHGLHNDQNIDPLHLRRSLGRKCLLPHSAVLQTPLYHQTRTRSLAAGSLPASGCGGSNGGSGGGVFGGKGGGGGGRGGNRGRYIDPTKAAAASSHASAAASDEVIMLDVTGDSAFCRPPVNEPCMKTASWLSQRCI